MSRWLTLRLRALRAFSFPLSALPVLAAVAATGRFSEWRIDVLLASVIGVVLLHAAGNLLNDYYDYHSGVDRKLDGDEGRPGRLLVRGELAPRDVAAEAMVCLVLAVPVSIYLLQQSGAGLLWFGGAAMVALYAYTGPPFKLKYRALGEPVIFLAFGPLLMTGAAYAQTGRWEWPAALLSIPVGLATTAVLLANNIRDMSEDESADIRTLAHRLGERKARFLYLAGIITPPLGVGILVATRVLSAGALACFVSLVPGCILVRTVWSGKRIPEIDARTARYVTVFLVTLWLGLVVR